MVSLSIDHREGRLIEAVKNLDPSIEIHVEALPIGDISITHGDSWSLLFERKSLRDLDASVKDGRYREQKARLRASARAAHITYIIENPHGFDARGMPVNVYTGCVVYTMYRDGLHVIVVDSVEETAEWIVQIYKKACEHPEKMLQAGDENYAANLKIKKRKMDNVDPKMCYMLQWGQVPGISDKLASSIVERFPSWPAFYREMGGCATDAERIKLLSSVPLVGGKKAQKIWEYLRE